MGLDSYIFKTTKQQAMAKRKEILIARNKDRSNGISAGNGMTIFATTNYSEYINRLKPDIYWRKYNQISAWLSEKVFNKYIKQNISMFKSFNNIYLFSSILHILTDNFYSISCSLQTLRRQSHICITFSLFCNFFHSLCLK